jgi:hypothetical protein
MRSERAILYAVAGGVLIILALHTVAGTGRVWLVYDGCECGRQRRWYQMPESIWARVPFSRTNLREGDPRHKHRYWDPQYLDLFPLESQK